MIERKTLTTRDIAQYCNVTQRTAIQWVNDGTIKVFRAPGKHSRIKREDFVAFLKEYDMPIPEELSANDSKKKILIVDDDKAMVKVLTRILENKGEYIIETAEDGFSAGQKFSAFKPDLMLLDIKMPKMDGFEVCAMIRNDPKNDGIHIIVISGHANQEDVQRVYDLGANAYFSKPFSNDDLLEKIGELLGRSQKVRSNG